MITTRANVKLYMGITDTSKDDLIDYLIPAIEEDFLEIRNMAFDEDSNGDIYPDNADFIAVQMVAFKMQPSNRQGGGFQSETLGSYSYTKDTKIDSPGYPTSIIKGIRTYVSSR